MSKKNTPSAIDKFIQTEIVQRLHYFAQHRHEIDNRLAELDREWDIERALETLAPTLILAGLGLSQISSRKWLLLSASVAGFLLQHGIQGWCPPLPVLRSIGFRTMFEIDEERYALKILRGDFDNVGREGAAGEILPDAVYRAVHSANT